MRNFKDDFEKWYRLNMLTPSIYEIRYQVFLRLPESMQWGVKQDFFVDVFDRYIEIYSNASGWGFMITKGGHNGTVVWEIEDDNFFETLKEARTEALKKAIEIYESK